MMDWDKQITGLLDSRTRRPSAHAVLVPNILTVCVITKLTNTELLDLLLYSKTYIKINNNKKRCKNLNWEKIWFTIKACFKNDVRKIIVPNLCETGNYSDTTVTSTTTALKHWGGGSSGSNKKTNERDRTTTSETIAQQPERSPRSLLPRDPPVRTLQWYKKLKSVIEFYLMRTVLN